VTPAEGIDKLGFRRWYERELIEGHVYLVTCVLCLILVAACLEQLDWRGPGTALLLPLAGLIFGGVLCLRSLRRYGFLLARAEHFGAQSNCARCATYGLLKITATGDAATSGSPAADTAWLRVQCKKCGHEWRIQAE
jgi:hypothetical protein